MLAKTFEFEDYNGNKRTETHYFNLSQAECYEMEFSASGGLTVYLNRIIAAQDMPTLSKIFKELILKSYGIKSDDGRQFRKSPEISKSFEETEAYSQLYMELATDSKAAADFINGIVPKKIAEEAAKMKDAGNVTTLPFPPASN